MTSTVLAAIYLIVLWLPLLCSQPGWLPSCVSMPNKASFYRYIVFLFVVYLLQAVGAAELLYKK